MVNDSLQQAFPLGRRGAAGAAGSIGAASYGVARSAADSRRGSRSRSRRNGSGLLLVGRRRRRALGSVQEAGCLRLVLPVLATADQVEMSRVHEITHWRLAVTATSPAKTIRMLFPTFSEFYIA